MAGTRSGGHGARAIDIGTIENTNVRIYEQSGVPTYCFPHKGLYT